MTIGISLEEAGINIGSEKIKSDRLTADVLDLRLKQNQEKQYDDVREKLKLEAGKAKFTVLDIGPGLQPVLSIDQKDGDLWVGVDVALGYEENQTVSRSERTVEMGAKRILIPAEAETVPEFKADLIMIIAPNPENIVKDGLLEQIEKFIGQETMIFIKLDNRTVENEVYGVRARAMIKGFLRKHHFVQDDLSSLGDRAIDTTHSKDAIGGTVFRGKKQ